MKRNLSASKPGATRSLEGHSPNPRRIRRIAYEAEVCERTVVRYLDGEAVRPGSRERIERTLAALAAEADERAT